MKKDSEKKHVHGNLYFRLGYGRRHDSSCSLRSVGANMLTRPSRCVVFVLHENEECESCLVPRDVAATLNGGLHGIKIDTVSPRYLHRSGEREEAQSCDKSFTLWSSRVLDDGFSTCVHVNLWAHFSNIVFV